MLPLPLPDDKGRCVILARNDVFHQDLKMVDMMRTNLMLLDIILEENDRVVVCGSVNMMDHENTNMALMVQLTPTIMKKMATLFQVTFLRHRLLSIIHVTATFLKVVQQV
jgi:hypothetical protein